MPSFAITPTTAERTVRESTYIVDFAEADIRPPAPSDLVVAEKISLLSEAHAMAVDEAADSADLAQG